MGGVEEAAINEQEEDPVHDVAPQRGASCDHQDKSEGECVGSGTDSVEGERDELETDVKGGEVWGVQLEEEALVDPEENTALAKKVALSFLSD